MSFSKKNMYYKNGTPYRKCSYYEKGDDIKSPLDFYHFLEGFFEGKEAEKIGWKWSDTFGEEVHQKSTLNIDGYYSRRISADHDKSDRALYISFLDKGACFEDFNFYLTENPYDIAVIAHRKFGFVLACKNPKFDYREPDENVLSIIPYKGNEWFILNGFLSLFRLPTDTANRYSRFVNLWNDASIYDIIQGLKYALCIPEYMKKEVDRDRKRFILHTFLTDKFLENLWKME